MSLILWPDEVDEVLAGDHVVALGYATGADGVVLLPLTNFGTRSRVAGTISVNTSVGAPRKLERMRANPKVALAFHTRAYADHDHPHYILVQGDAEISEPVEDFPATILDSWERFEPWADRGWPWRWWQRVYGNRVEIAVHVRRILVWPDLGCGGEPLVLGEPLPSEPPPSQRPPRKGRGPRLDSGLIARRAIRMPDALLGWIGADGYPVLGPVKVVDGSPEGVRLVAAYGLLPPGSRRAGLTAHLFGRGVVRQEQHKHTGWLEVAPDDRGAGAIYAPHTDTSYRMPDSRFIYRLVTGGATRLGARAARRAGSLPG